MVRIALAAALLLTTAAAVPEPVTLDLHPVVEAGAVSAIDVAMVLPGGPAQGFALTAPIVYPGATGVADRMTGLVVTDASGPVALTVRDDAAVPGGFPYYRHWQSARAVAYPLRLRYRARVQPPGGPGGPPFGVRAVGGGVSGALATLLMLPEGQGTMPWRLHWNLSDFPAGASAGTSFGEGDVVVVDGPERLTGGWFLAGPAGRLPVTEGFGASWLGTPVFDSPAAMAQAAKGHAYLVDYFPHLKPAAPYRVFLQFRDQAPFGGATALDQSFMYTRGPLKPGEVGIAPLGTIFHEMIHQWVGQIAMPQGVSSWFSEGLTSYYEAQLPMRGGFQSVADYGRHIDDYTAQYFTSKARNWSAEAITKVGFGDEEVRHTPYRRGELYFHDLDARIRAKSRGRRTLDSLMFPMFLAREKGAPFDQAAWVRMVTDELGPAEKGRFERLILTGTETIDPRSDSFGPCFRRVATTLSHDGRSVPGYRWQRIASVPDAMCRTR